MPLPVGVSTRTWSTVGAGLLAAGVLALSGCSGSTTGPSNSATTSTTTPTASPSATSTASAAATTQTICADINALQQSVDTLHGLTLNKQSIQTAVTTVQNMKPQVDKLVADAQSKYQAQVTAVRTAYEGVKTSVDAAKQAPDTLTFAAVRTSVNALGDSVKRLRSSVGGC